MAAFAGQSLAGLPLPAPAGHCRLHCGFLFHAAGLVVEVDGAVHAAQVTYDAERDRVLAAHGLRILRIPNSEIEQNLPTVLAQIAAACAQ